MGYQEISLKLPTDYTSEQLKRSIEKSLHIKEFTFQIDNKSLDARNKNNIHWQLKISVLSDELKGNEPVPHQDLKLKFKKRKEKVLIIGSGPAGFFSAYVLQLSGFQTKIIERGAEVNKRSIGIQEFEQTGSFNPVSNYAFGEGGAGTFSDGKLTSRSKHISAEKKFILESYIKAGAPEEIAYMAHPHLGSDNLKIIVKNLRKEYIGLGGEILFETKLEDLKIENEIVKEAILNSGTIDADYFIIAPGHSSFETYRMLIHCGIHFRTKNFALGSRIEHQQEIINVAQWGKKQLTGVKAAEYRLTSNTENQLPVYTFCMCPGGIIVPATAYKNTNIVNGMSLYNRNAKFANSACVAGISPEQLLGRETSAIEMLDWLEVLEQKFYEYTNSYRAPFCSISDFINKKETNQIKESSYPLGLEPAPLWELLPQEISNSLRKALTDFSRKIKGFETGNIMGLESKTSSPVQVLRDENKLCTGFKNLYLAGEGSGYAGGIISSGADGIKAAMNIIEANS